jgi:Kef-type K+ transport system membrane component KefB
LGAGLLISHYVLGYSILASLLIASLFSTHALISYPVIRRYGITRNAAVPVITGGTVITDGIALLLLALVSGIANGQEDTSAWLRFGAYPVTFLLVIYFIYPVIIEWFFLKYRDEVSQFIFVMLIVFSAALLAQAAGLEALLGAFFAGLILNRFVPLSSGLKKQIDFMGNALFIPVFLISIGMLVDVRAFVNDTMAIKVAAVFIIVALLTKFLAAEITARLFRLPKNEKWLMFGLSSSHASATLAIILVGYNIIIGESQNGTPVRLLDEDVLDGTVLLILVSCIVSSVITERFAKKIAAEEGTEGIGI